MSHKSYKINKNRKNSIINYFLSTPNTFRHKYIIYIAQHVLRSTKVFGRRSRTLLFELLLHHYTPSY